MMKKLLSIAFVFACLCAKGQTESKYKNYAWEQANKPAFSLGAEVYSPTKSAYNFGYGISAKGEKPLSEDLSLVYGIGVVGYNHKKSFKETIQPTQQSFFIPVKAGVKYFLGDSFYFSSDAGISWQLNVEKERLFAVSLGTGYIVKINERRSLDIEARYENWGAGNVRQTVLRIAYRADWL